MTAERKLQHIRETNTALRAAVRTTSFIWLVNALAYALFAFLGFLGIALGGGDDASLGTVLLLVALAVVSVALAPLLWIGRIYAYWLSAAVSGVALVVVTYLWLTTSWEMSVLVFVLNAIPLGVSVAALVSQRASGTTTEQADSPNANSDTPVPGDTDHPE